MRYARMVCDTCKTYFQTNYTTKVNLENEARDRGWSIGLKDTCPKCIKENRRNREERGERL